MSNNDLFGIFAGLGTALLILAGWRSARAWRTRRWRTVDGTVQSSSWRLIGTGEDTEVHQLIVTYGYTIDGVRFASGRVSLAGRSYGRQADADAAVARYAPGTRVTVFYNRRRPGDAVLEREKLGPMTAVIALVGIGLFVLAGVLFPADP